MILMCLTERDAVCKHNIVQLRDVGFTVSRTGTGENYSVPVRHTTQYGVSQKQCPNATVCLSDTRHSTVSLRYSTRMLQYACQTRDTVRCLSDTVPECYSTPVRHTTQYGVSQIQYPNATVRLSDTRHSTVSQIQYPNATVRLSDTRHRTVSLRYSTRMLQYACQAHATIVLPCVCETGQNIPAEFLLGPRHNNSTACMPDTGNSSYAVC